MNVEYDDEVSHCPSTCHNPYHEHVDQDHDEDEELESAADELD